MFQILDAMDYDFEHRKKAIDAIRQRDDYTGVIFNMWIGGHPDYKELL